MAEVIECLTAFSGCLSNPNHWRDFFHWMFDLYNSATVTDETRMVLLRSLLKIIENGGKGFKESMSSIFNKLKDALEEAENIELLLIITEVVLIAAKYYPNLMKQHFRDVIDILIGWLLDSTQCHKEVMTKPLEHALISLKDFWNCDIEFTATLLGQFIEDFERFYQELMDETRVQLNQPKNSQTRSRIANENLTSSEKVLKMAALIRIYVTVLKSIEKFKSPESTPEVTADFMSEAMKTILNRVNSVVVIKNSEDLVIACNHCCRLTLDSFDPLSIQFKQLMTSMSSQLLSYLAKIVDPFDYASISYIISSLELMKTTSKALNVELPINFVNKVFSNGSHCQKLRFIPSNRIQKSLFALHHSVLSIKNVPILEEAYRCLLSDIETSLTVLLSSEMTLLIEPNQRQTEVNYSEEEAVHALQSTLVSLAEIANTKHSLIVMWALRPTLVDLILQIVNQSNETLANKYPTIYYSLLYMLYSHSNKHLHFISNSNLLTSPPMTAQSTAVTNSASGPSLLFNTSMTPHNANYLSDIIQLLVSALKLKSLTNETTVLCIDWTLEILNSSPTHTNSLVSTKQMTQLIETIADLSFSKEKDVSIKSCKVMETVLKFCDDIDLTNIVEKYRKSCHLHIGNSDQYIQKNYLNLLAILPSPVKLKDMEEMLRTNTEIIRRESFICPEDIRRAIMALMQRDPSSSFTSNCFRAIISYILDNNSPEDNKWLFRWFHCCQSDDNPIKCSQSLTKTQQNFTNSLNITQIFDSHRSAQLFWSCWEVVQYCVANRLRTPLGKPQDTFTRIEATIKKRVAQIQGSHSDSCGEHYSCALKVRMLLLLMENMEKHVYNAIDGNSSRLYVTPKTAKTFFRTNKATCGEWIGRNRMSIMLIGLKCGEPATVVRHGQELLREVIGSKKQNNNDLEFILILIVEALIQLGSSDAAMGYYIWAKQTLGLKYLWIKAAAEEANGRFENALEQYDSIHKLRAVSPFSASETVNPEEDKSSHRSDFLNNRIVQCYLNVGRFDEAIEWSHQSSNGSTSSNLFNRNIDYSYLKAMSHFPCDLSNPKQQKTNANLLWDANAMYHKSQSQLYLLCVSKFNNPDESQEKQFEQLLTENINPLVSIPIVCSPSVESPLVSVLHRNAIALNNISMPETKISKKSNISPINGFMSSNASVLVNAMLWSKLYNTLFEKTTNTKNHSFNDMFNELNYISAKMARKQQNLKLSQSLLLQFAANACNLEMAKKEIENNSIKVNDISSLINVVKEAANSNTRSAKAIKFQLEASKLMYSYGDSRAAIDTLLSGTSHLLSQSNDKQDDEYMETMSKSLLVLVKYLQSDQKYIENMNAVSHPALSLLLRRFDDLSHCEQSLGPSDTLIGKLLLFSVNLYPDLAKSWYALGAWSYRWGRKLIDLEEDKLEHKTVTKDDSAYSLYRLSATSYFKFLHMSGHTGCESVNATLRLLRLILKHAPEMRDILEAGLSQTPTEPWKHIILQLFSRLNHPEHYVRQSISDLLCRIGRDSPHLIVFPAVAGSLTNKKDELLFDSIPVKGFDCDDTYDEDFDVDAVINEQEEESALMQNCYAALVETLSQQNPQLISQTKTFVHELRRITVLWDEVWIGTLMNHLGELKRQVATFEAEIVKIKANNLLTEEEKDFIIREKHNIFFRRVIYFLELTQLITNEIPETPHESWFQKNFSKTITETIKCIQSPADTSQPQQIVNSYQQLLQTIQKKAMMASNGRPQLIMDNISPILATLDNTVIPMPGLNVHSSSGTNITIQRVCRTVTTLHTKTKPKKLILFGSDGKPHTYLFKGHEDLHLDERIMQFLAIVNKMIVKYDNSKQERVHYRARHYSVTPLGNKSGLIQWVDGGQALYGLYKKWILNRDVSQIKGQHNSTYFGLNDTVYKPSEIFNKKLVAKGITGVNRSEWPSKVLVQVLQELMKETPIDLIAKELWCASVNAYDYWRLTQTFTYSNAVMSMIGYIIGLGDRHLDNILLDLSTGEVIHIDYNICFEKGKTLRVPERVSCRLTQNIVNAFGITGIEGTFRMSCEHILRVLRKGKETLLTLLEAFVYDPLIDWTPDHEEGYTGAIYGGARISELAKEGKLIPKHQMEKENSEAIVRLNARIRQIERQNNWPKISDDLTTDNRINILEDIIFNDSAIVSASRFANVTNALKATDKDKSKKSPTNKSSSSVKRNTYATNVWKKVKMKVSPKLFAPFLIFCLSIGFE